MIDQKTQTELEAAVFRRLVEHLRQRTDVQNIDMMNLAGFCRNCLSNWYEEAAKAKGVDNRPRGRAQSCLWHALCRLEGQISARGKPGPGSGLQINSQALARTGPAMDTKTSFAQGQLKSLVERIERLEEEKKVIAGDIKEIYAEAKANGFDTKILRKVISIRKKDRHEREEEEAILDLYLNALGMLPAERRKRRRRSSLGARAAKKSVDEKKMAGTSPALVHCRPVELRGPTMTEHQLSRRAFEKAEVVEMVLRMTGGGLTVGLLIILPALKILGWA